MQEHFVNHPIHGGNLAWAATVAGCPPSSILDFSASINPLGPPPGVLTAIQGHLSALCGYPDPNYTELRVAIAKFHQIPPDWILPGNGAAELLTWAGRELASLPGVYLPTPAFADYWRSLLAFDAQVTPISLLAEPQALSSNYGILVNNPHNPTGKLWRREEMFRYLEQFALVVVDEAFMDFLSPDQEQSLIAAVEKYPNLVIVRSLTKFYSLPGLRLGYAIAHPDRLRRWQKWRDPWSVNILAVAAGIAALKDIEFQRQTWQWLPPTRQQLFENLAALPGLQPESSQGNFLLVKSEYSSSQLQQRLLKTNRILIRDCLSFPELGDRYFRVAVRTQSENEQLHSGLARILG